MASITNISSSQTALQQAQAKLAEDQAAKAAADVIKADQQAIAEAEKGSSAWPPAATPASKGVIDISV